MSKRKRNSFVGRSREMNLVKQSISAMVEAFCVGNFESAVSFITFEGGSGVGKTRCLQEIRQEVGLLCTTEADGHLRRFYEADAVKEVFITFNGRGGSPSHMPPPSVLEMGGSKFLEVTILSELMYHEAYFALDANKQASVNCAPTFSEAMERVLEILQEGKQQQLVLYVLLDEMQLLAAALGMSGALFIKGMCDAMGRFMREDTEKGRNNGLVLVPCLAGCCVPEVGTFGASSWPKRKIVLAGLGLDDSKELVESGLESKHDGLVQDAAFQTLLLDCLGVPRFLVWAIESLRTLSEDDEGKVDRCREKLFRCMADWATYYVEDSSLEHLKEAFRYCLVPGAKVRDRRMAVEQCIRGYVYWKEVGGSIVFEAPIFLLNYLGDQLGIHQTLVQLKPKLVKKDDLEWPCLEMVNVRLHLARLQTLPVQELFPGYRGSLPLQLEVEVPPSVCFGIEERQLLSGKKCFSRPLDVATNVAGSIHILPWYGALLKTKGGNGIVDARCFLRLAAIQNPAVQQPEVQTLELWIQVKGDKSITLKALLGWCDDAFGSQFNVAGRIKVFVILAPYASVSAGVQEEFLDVQFQKGRFVLLLDCDGCAQFMPGFFQRCR